MIDTQAEIERRLAPLCGLALSDVNRAANMLTLAFGRLKPVTNFKGMLKYVGEWALHVQCPWQLERLGKRISGRDDLCGSEENADITVSRLRELLVRHGPTVVAKVSSTEIGGAVLTLSSGLRLIVVPDKNEGGEDWRFFAPGVNVAHLVIKGGIVAPESFD